ncbi:alpha-glucosidase/alpha-galactosidase [Thermoanaerobacterium thermosaccharolyticum]|uniref:family 4 glycosyl hydrolase n=1 Tax=Thermoanaerobacterium thermosaccharolyticum TaxID=1517 RepID=UPI0027A5B056|nr:alpha-glucosidase/alpha-galactosidase [Thermoanaerobacterium thermosaccharolyticum]
MKYVDNKVLDLNIAYIGGGSRGWAWNLMSDLAKEESISGTVKLYDIDYDAAHDNEIIGNSLSKRQDVKGKWLYKACETLKEALIDADFVIISILPGTFDEMESDVHAPEKYGIYQSVGDTVGPGGIVRALRTIPMFVDIANAIKEYCPDAWVINYTNPMTLCVRTLYEIFPEIKAFGCCHEVFGTQKLLSRALQDIKGINDVPREDIKINVLGINHFTWIDKARYKGIDLMPVYKQFVDKYYESGFQSDANDNWMNNSFVSAERVKFDLFLRYGIIAAAGDRHLAEFVPGYWYLKDSETVREWMFGLTPVSWRKEDLKRRLERSKKLISGEEKFELKETGEEGVKQIKALLGLGDLVTNLNIPNYGQIENVPYGSVVETNALFSDNTVKPISSGKLPDSISGLVLRHVYNQETILKAALTKNFDLAFSAFVNDPLVTISLKDAKKLFKEMLENTKEYLNGWKL